MPSVEVKYTTVFARTAASKKRIIVNVGGARSSKSYSVAQLLVSRFLSQSNKTFIITRKTFPSLKATAMHDVITLLQQWGAYRIADHNKTDSTIVNPRKGNIIRFISIEDPTRILSMKANYIWMEEANEFTHQDYLTLKMRLSEPTVEGEPNQIFLTLNPSDSYGWINQRLVNAAKDERDDDASNIEVIYSSYRDNPALEAAYIADLENLKNEDETYYKIFAEGVWAQSGSIIYSNYDIIPFSKFPTIFDERLLGLDFGFNNPAAAIFVGMKDGEAYLREVVYKSRLTNSDLIREVKAALWMPYRDLDVFADEAEPDRIEEFVREGFRIKGAPKGKNSIRDGIDFCKRVRLHVSDDSVNTIKEIRGYKWKEKDGVTYDEPVKYLDHAMDAFRYALSSTKRAVKSASSWGGGTGFNGRPSWMRP